MRHRPRLCFVGPMVGLRRKRVTTQGLILSGLFDEAGFEVVRTSPVLNRYVRLADMIWTIARRARNVEILIVEVYSGAGFLVADVISWLGRILGRRVVLWLHGGNLPEFAKRYHHWVGRVLRRADAIVSPSAYLARLASAHGLRATVIPNVLDLNSYSYRLRSNIRPRLFWMRNFHRIWNPEMAVRVLARLRKRVPDATLVMAGPDKGSLEDVRRLAAQYGISAAINFRGFLNQAEKESAGQETDIYLNTNHVDNVPVAVLEACAMGLPVVTTAVGGIPDLLKTGETALLVPDDDDGAMVRGIQTLLKDAELVARLSANGRRLAEQSSWTLVRHRWEELFAEVLRSDSRVATRAWSLAVN